MTGLLVILHLGGAIALLLWSTRMVRTGIDRAYGRFLKEKLRYFLRNPFFSIIFGIFLAFILQSSTAVTLLIASFVGSGYISGAAGLIAVRGGELGSALVIKVLTLNLTALVPFLLIIGTLIFMSTQQRTWRQFGRIIVGIALLLISLQMTDSATEPLRQSAMLPAVINYLSSDFILSFLIAAVFTFVFQSSIAGIILIASFATHNLIGQNLSIIMVLGVNFGSSLIAPVLTRRSEPQIRAVPLGNLLMRGVGSIIALIIIAYGNFDFSWLGETSASRIVNAHIVLNIIIMLLGIPLSNLVDKLTQQIVSFNKSVKPENTKITFAPSPLNLKAINNYPLALSAAKRELMHLADIVDYMLEKIEKVYMKPDKNLLQDIILYGKELDRRQIFLKQFLSEFSRKAQTDNQNLEIQNVTDACIKLQQAAALISHTMLNGAKQILNGKINFSKDDKKELASFFEQIMNNANLSFSILTVSDYEIAQQMIDEKSRLREFERQLRQNHLGRLRSGKELDMRASTLYLDVLQELKQLNTLLTSIAYPILDSQENFKETNLTTDDEAETTTLLS